MSLNENADSAAIVNAIVSLGASLNLPITAEGVEDAAIEERLRAIGCSKAQGWYYGRPLSVTAARRLLAERRLLQTPAAAAPVSQANPEAPAAGSQRMVG